MGRNPKLRIRLSKVQDNASKVVDLCKGSKIEVGGVAKGVCGNVSVARAMVDGGCSFLADSRIQNIINLKKENLNIPFMLLRLPMPSEIDEIVSLVNFSLVSMTEVVKLIDEACRIQNFYHDVIVMVDVGDLREGIWPSESEIENMAKTLKGCQRVRCMGVGTNVGCFGGVLPSPENLDKLVQVGRELEELLGYKLEIYSGGGTSSLALVEKGIMPLGINQLRVGEAILLGSDVTGRRSIPYLHRDTMVLEAEVIELGRKPSVPIGAVGADAFGNVPTFVDKGVRLRGILAIGKQDVRLEGISPLQEGVYVLGASSDHIILDLEELAGEITIGSTISFKVDYGAMLAATTSPYVKVVIEER
ncbi:alanine/ornithine racemase family PLP-dependent enzyme [Acetomicrobium sp.]|uniref:alanine/ornithine racemase family PLP-dependent enzyme n=1 Tax=Acetomicrobium sp. TaxID=1872099 RepID=UPI0016BA7629|nr:alanine/ornithine racemase family PLP-dependent enzyme [Synergistaceae bacterium]